MIKKIGESVLPFYFHQKRGADWKRIVVGGELHQEQSGDSSSSESASAKFEEEVAYLAASGKSSLQVKAAYILILS